MALSLLGRRMGPYVLLEEIGCGGMSHVYRGRDPKSRREVAIKVLTTSNALEDTIRRFEREIKTLTRLEHPNILPILESGSEGAAPYLVMPLVRRGTLHDALQTSPALTPEQVTQIAEQIGTALDYAHKRRVIHRDVKPHNIMVMGDGRYALADFGMVKLGEEWTRLTFTGIILGSPAYMSPEQALGETISHRTDIYSLGLVLYECLLGQKPFSGQNLLEMVSKQVTALPTPPSAIAPDIPAALEAALLRALAKNPEARFDSAGKLAEAIRVGVEALPPRARRAPLIRQGESKRGQEVTRASRHTMALAANLSTGDPGVLEDERTPDERVEAYEREDPERKERRRLIPALVLLVIAAVVALGVFGAVVIRDKLATPPHASREPLMIEETGADAGSVAGEGIPAGMEIKLDKVLLATLPRPNQTAIEQPVIMPTATAPPADNSPALSAPPASDDESDRGASSDSGDDGDGDHDEESSDSGRVEDD